MKKFMLNPSVTMTLVALLLFVGFSPRRAHAQTSGDSPKTYAVVWGNTLSGIAKAQCGNASLWKSIAAENEIKAPLYRIYADETVLKISCTPAETTPVAATIETTPHMESHDVADSAHEASNSTTESQSTATAAASVEPAPVDPSLQEQKPDASPDQESTQRTAATETQPAPTAPATDTMASSPSPTPTPLPTRNKKAKVKPAKIHGYHFVISGSNLQRELETKLLLFNNEEEKQLVLPAERVDLKPSIAVPTADGNTVIYVRLKKLPKQRFMLAVAEINNPIDSTQIQADDGKIPGQHPFLKAIASLGMLGARGGISLATTGNPFIAGGVMIAPPLFKLGVALYQKAATRKVEAAQAAVDKSRLDLYRASIETGNPLPKENTP